MKQVGEIYLGEENTQYISPVFLVFEEGNRFVIHGYRGPKF